MKKIIISIIILIILISIISIIYSRIDAYIKEAFPKDSILIIFQGNGFVEYQSSPAKWSGNYYIIKIK